ncbi:hypothetical protein [Cupriavidus malaysiensis]|uniref:Uncharacterized protein n=1 Tax=Cupriavidus malaysiensis TaxID=367825 RepID=A0ABN4TX30_9BURK|nr:hypothetical protein [Cupriavidus malaysiensis]AOZ11124.1 hypothetical protein BKK80_34775 [Cupriavidus malaysiensis]
MTGEIKSTSYGSECDCHDQVLHTSGPEASKRFMNELLESVETLMAVADQYGARTLADLFHLASAVLEGSFVEVFDHESTKVVDVVRRLRSAATWLTFIRVDGEKACGVAYRELQVSGSWLPRGTAVLAYSSGGKWNGFEQPWFPRGSMLQLVGLMPEELTFDPVNNVVRVVTEGNEPLEVYPDKIMINGEAVETYVIGDGWCWEAA